MRMQGIRKLFRNGVWLHISGILVLCAGLMLAASLKSEQYQFPYPLDDSYIHLSIAESWVDHGIPSPESSQPAFSTSSPLYSSLLAFIITILGPWIYWPLVIGILNGMGFIWLVHREFRSLPLPYSGTWLWVILFFGPIPLLMILGMEHMLQVWIWTAFFFRVRKILLGEKTPGWELMALGLLVVSIRYEGIFLVAATSLVLFFSGFQQKGTLLALTGILSFTLPGFISVLNGGTFLPLSLLMKGHLPGMELADWGRFLQEILTRLYDHPFMFPVLFISAIGWAGGSYFPKPQRLLSAILQLASWGHVVFAEIGGYRYEAWIVVLHLILLAYLTQPFIRSVNKWPILATGWLVIPLIMRTLFFTVNYPLSVQNIYDQSIQTGQFIQQSLEGESIAIQDIGAATYLADFEMTDLAGIGDSEINALFQARNFGPESVRKILEQREVSYAIIQQAWMGWVIPESWIPVGCWTTSEAFIVPNAEVFFWAADTIAAEKLSNALQDYRSQLPERVLELGPYVSTELPLVTPLP